jgi:hypothetical protein
MRRAGDDLRIRRVRGDLRFAQAPIVAHLLIHVLRIEVCIEQQDAVRNIVERVAQYFELVGVTDNIGNVGVAEQPAAVRKNRALQTNDLTIGAAQIEGGGIAGPDQTHAFGDVGVEIGVGGFISVGIAADTSAQQTQALSPRSGRASSTSCGTRD